MSTWNTTSSNTTTQDCTFESLWNTMKEMRKLKAKHDKQLDELLKQPIVVPPSIIDEMQTSYTVTNQMTEQEYLTTDNIYHLISSIPNSWKNTEVYKRKLRLWGCALCRQVPNIRDSKGRIELVEQAERYADGEENTSLWSDLTKSTAPQITPLMNAERLLDNVLIRNINTEAITTYASYSFVKKPIQADALREILGNPFDKTHNPFWKECKECDGTGKEQRTTFMLNKGGHTLQAKKECVWCHGLGKNWTPLLTNGTYSLAETIYLDRDYTLLPILGDKLEDAGCTHVKLLEHLHSDDCHVRGCWALDMILGRS